ncbi:hypothetical protein [Rhizobium esperanzae]|uniref:hypothetical protein n=1 Tax=Rhizobium esperanzae TaxID=1967781 RepID=UPI00160961A1|nr:hypothetical protein [Rhizobium esperanzae]
MAAALILAMELSYILSNVHFYKNFDLYNIYTQGHYQNFQFISEHDKLFMAANKIIDCSKTSIDRADRIEIATSSIFFIETSMFLTVNFKKIENGQCVDKMMFRIMPG